MTAPASLPPSSPLVGLHVLRFASVSFESFQARSTHAHLPWGDIRQCVYLRKRKGSSFFSRSLLSFCPIVEPRGLQVRRFRNVPIGRHRNRTKPYERQEQMFYYYSHSIVATAPIGNNRSPRHSKTGPSFQKRRPSLPRYRAPNANRRQPRSRRFRSCTSRCPRQSR